LAEVRFAGARAPSFHRWWVPGESLLAKMEKLFYSAGLDRLAAPGRRVALKCHMGEPGDVHYIRPIYVSKLVDVLKGLGSEPVVVETSGLGWMPGRTTAEKYLEAARRNGFAPETIGAPIVFLDGPDGIDGIERDGISVARGLEGFDSMVVLSHVTGHVQACFGGAIKNIGLGCVTKTAKFRVHYHGRPVVTDRCTSCGACIGECPAGAIEGEPPQIDPAACAACNVCLDVCGEGGIRVRETSPDELSRRIAENAAAVAEFMGRENMGYINLLLDIIPHCDCHPHSDSPIVPDIGILASTDPVAVDRASVDLVNQAPVIPTSVIGGEAAGDRFASANPGTHWRDQLDRAEELGMGEQVYELKEV